jgi:hypothetical protein
MSYASANGPPTSTRRHIRLGPNEGHCIPFSGENGTRMVEQTSYVVSVPNGDAILSRPEAKNLVK